MKETRKVYVMKYALSTGVRSLDVEIHRHEKREYASAQGVFTTDWVASKEEAIVNVRRKVDAKRKALQKQLKRLDLIYEDLERGVLPMVGEVKR